MFLKQGANKIPCQQGDEKKTQNISSQRVTLQRAAKSSFLSSSGVAGSGSTRPGEKTGKDYNKAWSMKRRRGHRDGEQEQGNNKA